jgi:two-component system, chemotaxis family, chemotaxis protein CheY
VALRALAQARLLMSAHAGSDRKILIVEDDDLIRRAVQMVLEWEGYQVDSATNGQEALDYLRAGNRPRLIVLDLMMPVLDGQHFRQEQLRDPSLAFIPVIVVSACSTATSVNAVHHVRKPFEVQELLDAIRDQLSPAVAK